VDVAPAPHAADPGCASVLVAVRSIEALGQLERRDTTGQSTAAWGDPPVVLRCGVEPPGPTTQACETVGGVDWVVARTDQRATYTTYGRSPAVQVELPAGAPADVVIGTLSAAVAPLPQSRQCL
jgi:hypothetical protein